MPSSRELAHPRSRYGKRQSQDLNPRSFGGKLVSFLLTGSNARIGGETCSQCLAEFL